MSKYDNLTKSERDIYQADIVAEEAASYLYQKKSFLTPYTDRTDLAAVEKVCIGNYQDLHPWNEQKRDWSFDIPEDWKDKPWCYAINNCCRSPAF